MSEKLWFVSKLFFFLLFISFLTSWIEISARAPKGIEEEPEYISELAESITEYLLHSKIASGWETYYIYEGKMWSENNNFSMLFISDILARLGSHQNDILEKLVRVAGPDGNMRYKEGLPPDTDDTSLFISLLLKTGISPSFSREFVDTVVNLFDEKKGLVKTWIGKIFPWGFENPADPHVNINILRALFNLSETYDFSADEKKVIAHICTSISELMRAGKLFHPSFYYIDRYFVFILYFLMLEDFSHLSGDLIIRCHDLWGICNISFECEYETESGPQLMCISAELLSVSVCGYCVKQPSFNKMINLISEGIYSVVLYGDYPYDRSRKFYISPYIVSAVVLYALEKYQKSGHFLQNSGGLSLYLPTKFFLSRISSVKFSTSPSDAPAK